jgi:hypothetical protein
VRRRPPSPEQVDRDARIASGELNKWSRPMTATVAATLREPAVVTVEATYEEGHFEGLKLALPEECPLLEDRVRYRAEGLLSPPVGAPCLQAFAIEAVSKGRTVHVPPVRVYAYRAPGDPSQNKYANTETTPSAFDVLTAGKGDLAHLAMLYFGGRSDWIGYKQERCRATWRELFSTEGNPSLFSIFDDVFAERDVIACAPLPTEPHAAVQALRDALARAANVPTPNGFLVYGAIATIGRGALHFQRLGLVRIARRRGSEVDVIAWEDSLERRALAAGHTDEMPTYAKNVVCSTLVHTTIQGQKSPEPEPPLTVPVEVGDRLFFVSGGVLQSVADDALSNVLCIEEPESIATWLARAAERAPREGTDWALAVVDVLAPA